ncbi:MAG: hypothetical protein WCG27_04890, partial [Pseudomonadota bacterium]
MHKLLALLCLTIFPLIAFGDPHFSKIKREKRNKIYISFQWHMHQPIYWPLESVVQTQNNNRYSFNLYDIFNSRRGPYTSWPFDAVKMADEAGLAHAGAQISFSGSLIENLNNLWGSTWPFDYTAGRQLKTSLGHPRIDLVAFGYDHPMMPLISYKDIRRQIQAHHKIVGQTFGDNVSPSKGIFPPENSFASWMIPALVDEGLEWVLVDNIHMNRTRADYPWAKQENLFPPNPSDQMNPAVPGDQWIALTGVWAPSKVSGWAERPHWVAYRDPETGEIAKTPEGNISKMIAVPTERYLGNEDGRGGFGALNYDSVMSQFEKVNNDSNHPIILVLHHDGDNYGGGADSYYHSNFASFIDWLKSNQDRFELTTIQDYLDRFPPAPEDIIHVEPGSWAGADNGDPEFKKWLGDPAADGYSPDRNSWAVMTAAQNLVDQAESQKISPEILKEAIRYRMVSQTSCYEYWDGTEMWDSHPTRASNRVVELLSPLLQNNLDTTGPSLFMPQRDPYNPGGMEWGRTPEPSDFTVWTYAYDFSGLEKVLLRYRVLPKQRHPLAKIDYSAIGDNWQEIDMSPINISSRTNPLPLLKATEYSAKISSVTDALVSYQVTATDKKGNIASSMILHVYVGTGGQSGEMVSVI